MVYVPLTSCLPTWKALLGEPQLLMGAFSSVQIFIHLFTQLTFIESVLCPRHWDLTPAWSCEQAEKSLHLRRWYSSGRDRSASECISSQDHWRLKSILSKAEWCERENEGLLTRARRIRGGGNTNQSPEGQEMNQLRQEQGSQVSGQMEQQGEKPGTRKVLVCLRAKGRFLRLG